MSKNLNRYLNNGLRLAALLVLAGCGSEPEVGSRTQSPAPTHGGTFRIALESIRSLDPALTDDVYQATLVNQLFSGLVQWDADLNVVPDIAHAWTISRDGLHYSFQLADDARFHNGRPVTAGDFIYSFTRLFTPEVPPRIIQDYLIMIDGVDAFMDGREDSIRGLRAPDPHTLEIELNAPYPSFLHVLCMDGANVVPREEVERLGAEGFGWAPVGTGPFRLASRTPGERIVLVANRDYFGTPAYLDSLVAIHLPEEDSERRIREAFLEGGLHAREMRESEIENLRRVRTFQVVRRLELSMEFLGFNLSLPPFHDRRVRQAVAMAVCRHDLTRAAGEGFRSPVGLLPPGMPGYTPEPKLLEENLDRARSLLAEAGYGPGNPLRFTVLTSSRTRHAEVRDSLVVFSLAEAGIQAEIRNLGWNELNDAIDGRTAQAFQITWIADLPDPDSFLYTLITSGGLYNLFEYSNPRVDSLLHAGRDELNVALRLARYREAEKLVLADAPIVPLFNVMTVVGFQSGVRGVEMSPFGICSLPMEKIWIQHPEDGFYAGF